MIDRRLGLACWAGAALAVLGCRKAPASAEGSGENGAMAAPVVAAPDGGAVAGFVLAPPRCRATSRAFALDDGRALDDLEIGVAEPFAGGQAVGFVHRSAGARLAAVALLGPGDADRARIVDLGPTAGDVPPPKLSPRGADLIVAAYGASAAHSRRASTRDLILRSVSPSGAASAVATIPQTRDDSLAFDFATAGAGLLVVWDESTPARGVIRGSSLGADLRVAPPRDLSPPESDAEQPRVWSGGPGYLVLWIARRPDPSAPSDAAAAEVTGEERAFGWLELLSVDAQGAPLGPVRRLTSPTGHVSAYDVARLEGDPAALLVVARDDGETVDGSGGRLLRIHVSADVVDPPVALPTDVLGRGAPAIVDPAFLAWVGRAEQLRLIPLDASGAPSGPSSAEDEMNDGRPLLITQGGKMLVAVPSDGAAQLRTFACIR
jgi:hypothetical protein